MNTNKYYDALVEGKESRMTIDGYQKTLMREMDIVSEKIRNTSEADRTTQEYKLLVLKAKCLIKEMKRAYISVLSVEEE